MPASELADAAQLLAIPAAGLPPGPMDASWPPWRATRIADPLLPSFPTHPPSPTHPSPSPTHPSPSPIHPSPGGLAGALVVDLSSMWAGPLCARLLGLAGARVIKVESADRPDGARAGNQEFYDWLHAGHESLVLPFRPGSGRSRLAGLLSDADVVIEASRPRALEQLGLAPGTIPHKAGQVWLSITGYGREVPGKVAFGDDAAVAGGLVGWARDGEPVFCADAIADPLSGACGALAIARSRAGGGGELIDLPMRMVAAAFAAATAPEHGEHEISADGSSVTCRALRRQQAVRPPARPLRHCGGGRG